MPRQRDPRDGYVAVGRVLRPWGLRGELKVEPLTDFPDRFAPGARLWAAGNERTVERSRLHRGDLYLKLAGLDTPEAAETIRDVLLEVPESDLHSLDDGAYYHYQLEGLTVRSTAGEPVGTVHEVLEPGGNPVLVVRGSQGEALIPFIDDVIRRVDLTAGIIEIDVIEGLLPDAPRTPRAPHVRRRRERAV
jgi:16S rRNA processing protein RimM